MGLKIAVCIKSVPDPDYYNKITIDAKTKTITRAGIPAVVNAADKHALEAALRVKEQHGGTVTVFSMAPPEAKSQLLETLAMGADEAVLLSDRAFAGADTLATAYTLAEGIRQKDCFDLVFTGTESADGATAQVPAQLAEWLDMAHLWNVREFSLRDDRKIHAKIKLDDAVGEYLVRLPALLAVGRDANKPRYTTAVGVMKARKKPLNVIDRDGLQVAGSMVGQAGSPTWPGDIAVLSVSRKGEQLQGSVREIAIELLARLQQAGVKVVSQSKGDEA